MKKLIAATFAFLIFTGCGFAQTSSKNTAELEASMEKFINSIKTKNTEVFLSYISPDKGLNIMNTIDQGEAGNADNPMFDSNRSYKDLAADFKKKGEFYQDMFETAEYNSSFYDAFSDRQAEWQLVKGNKFQLIDQMTNKPTNAFYVKWEKQGDRWYATEVGRYIS